jgi:hypothetical protein
MVTAQRIGLALLAAVLLAVPTPAAEVDKYLPNDTESVQVINVRQIVDSALFKKYALDPVTTFLKNTEEAQKILKELDFDPLKDLNSYIQANGGSDKIENAMYILHGKFNPKKLAERAEQLAKDQPTLFKVHKDGDTTLYQVVIPVPGTPIDSIWLALVDETTIVGSPSKDYIQEALDKKAGKKKTMLRKEVQDLIGKADAQQSFWIVAFSKAFLKGPLVDDPNFKPIKDVLEKVDNLSGGITVTDEVKGEFTLVAKSTDAAQDLQKQIEKGLDTLKDQVGTGNSKGDALAKAFLSSIKVTAKDKTITLSGQLTKKDLEKMP